MAGRRARRDSGRPSMTAPPPGASRIKPALGDADDRGAGVRIVSVNAWGGALSDPLLAWLPGSGADVVCLQEVTRTPGLTGWTRFEDGERTLPQRAGLLDDVRGALPRHQAIFVASDSGPVHDDAGTRHRQDFGVATLVAERLPVCGVDSAFVHGAFTDHDEWTVADRPRIALAVHTVDRDTGRPVRVVQVHGLRDPAGKGDTPARRRQAERLAELVRRIRGPEDLVVLCGDLNLLPGSETFGVLAEAGLTDLVGTADTRTSHYRKPVRHASYLLVSDVSAVKHFEVLAEPEVSDHRALMLEI
jgi:endonuclease/exonuclease/phosphatase family metal-dependent hydrolase